MKKIQKTSANNQIKEIYYIKKSDPEVKEGTYVQLFNKRKILEGTYSNNFKTGEWHYYDYSGKLNFSGGFENDLKQGRWTYYYNGKLSAEIYYHKGEADSMKAYFENGILSYEMKKNSDSTGYCKSYYPNGVLKESFPLKNNKIDGLYTLYFISGQLHRETEYVNDQAFSVLKTFDNKGVSIDGGTLSQGNGTYITYYLPENVESNKINIYIQKNYKDGLLNGPCIYYYPKGIKMLDGSFEAGFRTGIWKLYNEDGSVSSSQNYESDFYKSIRKAEPDIYYYGDDAMFVEKMPEFQGGDEQRIMFLVKNLTYPNDARLKNIQGTVWVNFVVSITGEIESARIITSVSESLDNEVIKLVMLMPRWNPGLQGGIPVRVSFNMPVKFTLQ